MIGYLHIVELLAMVLYGGLFLGLAALVRKYPETIAGISTMPKAEREKLNLPKIGVFVAKWLNVSAVVVFLGMWIPKSELRVQVIAWVPVFLLLVASAYLIKYKKTRFSKEPKEE